jgi:voltage-gated potassium channel
MDNPVEESAVYARIQARDAIREFARVLSHLRGLLFILLSTYIVLSIVMYYVGGAVDSTTRAPASAGQVAYFCAITALTIGYGDVIPTTDAGRFIAVLLGFQGVLITGLVTAAAVYGVQAAAHRAGIRAR